MVTFPGFNQIPKSSSADWPYICVHEITSWLEWPLKGTAESRRIIQPLKSSDIILLLRTFHLSKDDCATSRYNFSFHYSMGGSHTYEVSGLAISTCQLFCPSSLERCHWWTNQARQALIKWSAYYIQLWHTQKTLSSTVANIAIIINNNMKQGKRFYW